MDAPTRAELFDVGAGEIATRALAREPGSRIDPEMAYVEGSDVNIQTASASAMAEQAIRQMVLRAKALLLDGAEWEDLDRLVADRWSPTIVRTQAGPAVGPLALSRNSGSLLAGTVPVGSRFKTASGVTFETLQAAGFGAGDTGPHVVDARCVTAGTGGNVAAGSVTQSAGALFDPALLCTNPEPMAGGRDRETDPHLRARARAFWLTARRGTVPAIEQGALTVAGIQQATAIEETDESGPTGRVALLVADQLGQANTMLVSAVRSAEIEYRCAGVVLDISGSTPTFVPIRLRLRFVSGVNTIDLAARVVAAVVARVNALAPGRTLEVSLITAAARSVQGVIVLDDAVIEPVGDVVPSGNQVFRTSTALVAVE